MMQPLFTTTTTTTTPYPRIATETHLRALKEREKRLKTEMTPKTKSIQPQ